jgi:hypothetical protein
MVNIFGLNEDRASPGVSPASPWAWATPHRAITVVYNQTYIYIYIYIYNTKFKYMFF